MLLFSLLYIKINNLQKKIIIYKSMRIYERKKVIKEALVNSFVEEHDAYKNTISFINKELCDNEIIYQYTYDEFCVDFLDQTLKEIENVDIFDFDESESFYSNFWVFNLYNLKNMLSIKLDTLGYKYDDVYNNDVNRDIFLI